MSRNSYQANALKPFAPTHVKGKRDKYGNINISWIRRARYDNDWRDNVDVPLDEREEKYLIEVLDGEKIIRILESSSTSVIYSADQQIADFKEVKANITVKIYQLSSIVGRGYPAIATI